MSHGTGHCDTYTCPTLWASLHWCTGLITRSWDWLVHAPLPSNRHHWSHGDCLEGKKENYQVRSVQYCVQRLCTVQRAHIWTDLTVLWIAFCLTGPISPCLGSFCISIILCITVYMCRIVTWWGEPGGHLTRKNPSPIWSIMCLVSR